MHERLAAPPRRPLYPPATLVWADADARPRAALVRPLTVALAVAAAVAAVIGVAIIVHALLPSAVTDDTYAFLDWGRDLRHGIFPPLLLGRTFHPVPLLAAALVSSLGTDAAPGAAIVLCIAGLLALAIAAWKAARLLRLPAGAPPLAALLALTSPMLVGIAFAGYINLPFATLELWALVWELRIVCGAPVRGRPPTGADSARRRRIVWTLLVLGGLVRPEGWAFLVFYGLYDWNRLGRPLQARRLAPIIALALGPTILWTGLEWGMFGSPLYSFTNTRMSGSAPVPHTSAGGLYENLSFSLVLPAIVAAVVGAAAITRIAPRRAGRLLLGGTAVAALTVLVLAQSRFHVPSRHFSVLVSYMCVLAAAGITAPAALAARARPAAPWRTGAVALSVALAALVVGLGFTDARNGLRGDFRSFDVERATGDTLAATIDRIRPRVDVRDAPPGSVALTAAIAGSELVWDLGVPYDVVDSATSRTTRLFVQPSPRTFAAIQAANLTNRYLVKVPGGWRNVTGGAWRVWSPLPDNPVVLRAPLPPGAS